MTDMSPKTLISKKKMNFLRAEFMFRNYMSVQSVSQWFLPCMNKGELLDPLRSSSTLSVLMIPCKRDPKEKKDTSGGLTTVPVDFLLVHL
jgi:hypothetical protein